MEDLQYLGRLKAGQEQFLEENTKKQESRTKLLDDYKKLIEKLKTLPDTISQPTMVPIGNIAFLPGKLIHTNEIMVLLGDNWFVERSAKQSVEIAQRRIQMVEKQIDDLRKENEHIKGNLSFTQQFEHMKMGTDTQEIKEELPKSYESSKGKRRIAHKAKHNVTPRTVSFDYQDTSLEEIRNSLRDLNSNGNDRTINHAELMSRLNQLEKEENKAEQDEHEQRMAAIMNGTYQRKRSVDEASRERHVQFRNVDSLGGDDDNVIQFQHTRVRERSSSLSDIPTSTNINTPADIYERFSNHSSSSHLSDSEESKPLKSILKKDSRSGSTENLKLKPILKTSPEHRPGTPEAAVDEPTHSILKTPPDTQASDRRPGTPEHVLEKPHSILKTEDIYIVSDDEDVEIKPILKSHEIQPSTHPIEHYPEEMRSILKHSSSESPTRRPFSPELLATNNENINSILKTDGRVRNRTLSPERPVPSHEFGRTQSQENIVVEPRPILKNQTILQGPTAFSGTVVERSQNSTNDKTESQKPMSLFKASRMKK